MKNSFAISFFNRASTQSFVATLLLLMSFSQTSLAYPEFIGYGYGTCITCHYNGHGSGPLNDYGRALWSAEIASRRFYSDKKSDEDIAASSGFFGSKELPYWVRPHLKYRGINVRSNPGSKSLDASKFYQMQADMGATLQADPDGKYLAVITYGNSPRNEDYGAGKAGLPRVLAKEYYFRAEIAETLWLYGGVLEKVYGLRNIDHTSFQRTFQGFNQRNNSTDGNSESQGLVLHKVSDKWEIAGNYFFGNPYDDVDYKQKGYSAMGEYEVGEKKRLGASVFSAKNESLKKDLLAVHYRQGLSKGSAIMFEYGLIADQPTAAGTSKSVGSYNLIQSLISLSRGYNLKTTIERYNHEFKASSPDIWKWSTGLLFFPAPRLEFRAEVVNGRSFSNQQAPDDTWALQGQIHVSL